MKGYHHLHVRKRVEPYPARSLYLRFLDKVVIVVGIAGPLFTLPQIYKIFSEQNAAGVSEISFGVWALFDLPWILYGLAHKEAPIVITYSLWCLFNIIVVIGAITYG